MGLGMPAALWGPVLDALRARGVSVSAVDHAGVGEAADRAPRDTMAELAGDLLGVLPGPVHLVGVSMGGMVCQELALRRPDRVRSLTLVATTDWGPRVVLPPTAEALSALLGERDRGERLRRLLFPPGVRDAQAMRERVARMAGAMAPPATFRAHLRAAAGHDVRNRLSTLRVPTLVVKPALDALIPPRCSDALARRIPGARLLELSGAGHGLIAQVPDVLAGAILDHARAAEAA